MKEHLRILHIMSGFGGGISAFIESLAKGLPSDITIDVATYDGVSPAFQHAILKNGGNIYTLDNPKKSSWTSFKRSYQKLFKENDYDAVHCHIQGYRAAFYYVLTPQDLRERFYIHSHFIAKRSYPLLDRFEPWLNRKLSAAYVGCSIDAIHAAYGDEVSEEAMMVIPNSIDRERYLKISHHLQEARMNMREHYPFKEDDYVIGQVGRFVQEKNHVFTIRLAQALKRERIPVQFALFGEGALKETVLTMIEEGGVADIVHVFPRNNHIETIYAGIDLLFLPSLSEGFGTVAIEAQAMDLNVLMSTNVPEEVDLNMGLVHAFDLSAPLQIWINAVKRLIQHTASRDIEASIQHLQTLKLTNEEAAHLYAEFLRGERTHYTIKEQIQKVSGQTS